MAFFVAPHRRVNQPNSNPKDNMDKNQLTDWNSMISTVTHVAMGGVPLHTLGAYEIIQEGLTDAKRASVTSTDFTPSPCLPDEQTDSNAHPTTTPSSTISCTQLLQRGYSAPVISFPVSHIMESKNADLEFSNLFVGAAGQNEVCHLCFEHSNCLGLSVILCHKLEKYILASFRRNWAHKNKRPMSDHHRQDRTEKKSPGVKIIQEVSREYNLERTRLQGGSTGKGTLLYVTHASACSSATLKHEQAWCSIWLGFQTIAIQWVI
ncbi:hypothetical protein EDB89DRAFT_2152711 [Lactarius sanguifluus]|nr:hypothetical protein EDB89DRAFT_2152711 [Lactarius sanguifluus]